MNVNPNSNNIAKWNAEHKNGPGRPAGVVNKVTARIREAFALCLEERMDMLGQLIDRVAEEDPKSAVDLIIKISERFVPKLNQTAITGAEGAPLDVKFTFGKKIDTETNQDFDIEDLTK